MGLFGLLKVLFNKYCIVRELTPKGEYFFKYIKDIRDNNIDSIESYEDEIERIRSDIEKDFGVDFSRNDTLDLLDIYYKEYF